MFFHHGKSKKLFLIWHLIFSLALLSARDVTISVKDKDLDLPLEGAVVHSWDGTDHTCDENGKAVLSVPDDRQVYIQISYPGYETGRLAIPVKGDNFSSGLSLGGAIESRELVIEAKKPGSSETKSGRSVAISGENLERSSRIGLIEDVMTSIKLLPGVGYTGMFNAMPSIRGGDPGDLMAVLDGYYIENPYFWGGGFSIFDPNMVASAQLSHGIFSTRYGHTISGLLEVSSKKAATDHAELELGISTSSVNLNVALPTGTKGGLMIMGKVTYWDPFVWTLKQLSKVWNNDTLQLINAVTTAPYIRSSAASYYYRFNTDLELTASAFIGSDGVGVDYLNDSSSRFSRNSNPLVDYKSRAVFNWDNLQMFLISGLTYNPLPSMVLKASVGAGYEASKINGGITYDYLHVNIPNQEYTLYGDNLDTNVQGNQSVANAQGRIDYDWSLGNGFLLATGVQELYSHRLIELEGKFFYERKISGASYGVPGDIYIHYPVNGKTPDTKNTRYNSSGYVLTEYSSEQKRFGAELGLRVDHMYFQGDSFDIQTIPVYNPRLNLDFNLYRGSDFVGSFDLTAGTGLFSSMNDAINMINVDNNIKNYELRPNRSWTSVLGLKTDFTAGWSFNIEGYYKYVYDRAYQYMIMEPGKDLSSTVLRFNGNGIIWGFDLMLQKFDSRYWDGWLSYTFTNARYHDPESPRAELDSSGASIIEDSGWYYPYFHRFHNLNLVLNFKPSKTFNIYTRLGLASGQPKPVVGQVTSYDVFVLDGNGQPVMIHDDSLGIDKPLVIKKYKRDSTYSNNSRTTWSIPLDMKFSYTTFNPRNKVQTEMYIAAENILSVIYTAKGNPSFNQYTGDEDNSSDTANYELPVPMISVGVKWSY